MKLEFLGCLVDAQESTPSAADNGVRALAYSPNGRKLALATNEPHIELFNERGQRRDRFSTKPADPKYGKRSYVIRCLVFSPDSTRLAVGQSDNIVFVYRLGESWDEKKVICNKFSQNAAVSAILWPEETRLIIGLLDGKVRAGSAHSNKCTTLYRLDAGVVALSQHPSQRSFVSGHEDGAIVIYSLESRSQTKICVHSTAPYCLALCISGILAAGADRRVISYSADNGRILQDFDFGNESDGENGGDFYASVVDPTGHSVLFGSFNRLRLLCWNKRRGAWIEDALLDLNYFYTVTALAWKPYSTTIVAGGSGGAVVQIDCCMRRALLKGRFETAYISLSQVFISDTKPDDNIPNDANGSRRTTSVVRSAKNYALTDIRILGGRNGTRHFAVTHTSHTLIVADLHNGLCSEIPWQWSGSERFYFNSDNVCLVINAGEITFIEYGVDEALGWIRTERVNPHLVSVRVSGSGITNGNTSMQTRRRLTPRGASTLSSGGTTRVCRVAYLLDVHTIAVANLQNNMQLAHITHHNAIDWIELNESAQKLLFRDVGSSLYLRTLDAHDTRCLLGYCSYAQWVPRSDVVVAQSASQLCIWYNTEEDEVGVVGSGAQQRQQNVFRVTIQGDVEAVLRDEHRTEVIVLENTTRVAYELDGAMIEFGTALNERDLSRALVFLERCERVQSAFATARDTSQAITTAPTDTDADNPELTYDLAPMWQRLADVALADRALLIAQRCYASLNDFPKVRFLQETIEIADWALQQDTTYRHDTQYEATDALIEAGGGGIATSGDDDSGYASVASIAAHYETRARLALLDKNFKRAEQIYLENGNPTAAINVYCRLGQWEAALELAGAINYERFNALKDEYYRMLEITGQKERAAEMRVQEGNTRAALEIYLESGHPTQAARLMLQDMSRTLLAETELMQRVQNALLRQGEHDEAAQIFEATEQYDSAIEYYRNAKNFAKAIQVARRWRPDAVVALEELWANTLFTDGNFDAAINHFLESGQSLKAADAAIRAKEWERAIEILGAIEQSDISEVSKEVSRHYVEIARNFEADGEYEVAEKFYLASGRPADAVEMYNRATRWTDAYQLAAKHFGDEESRALYTQKAEALERVGRLAEAEKLYIGVDEPTRAITMYKTADRREDVIRLVALYHPERIEEMHKRFAEECEERGDLKTAEEHYMAARDLMSALEMYREAGQYADAFRVANAAASESNGANEETATHAARVVAYAWAKNLGGDAAVKLLMRHGLLNNSIDVGITRGDFEFVFELCNLGAKTRLAEVQQKYAEHLEDEGDWTQAEEFYLKAGKGREAILMHVHNQNWEAAERLAGQQPDNALVDVLLARGRAALNAGQVVDAESYFLRAARADLILAHYRDSGAWSDALRVAAKYVPDVLPQLQHDYELAEASRGGAASAKIFVEQATNWERQGDYRRAVDCYLKVDERSAKNADIFVNAQFKAAELIAKFLVENEGLKRVRDIGERLAASSHNVAAADVFLIAKTPQRAVEELIKAHEWTRARRIAGELPQAIGDSINEVIDTAHREYLRKQGSVGELADVDASAAVDLLAERGDWDAALSAARQLNNQPSIFDKYLLMRAGHLVDVGQYEDAMKLFLCYGTSLASKAFSLYKFIIDMSANSRNCGYDTYVMLRDMLTDLNAKISAANNDNNAVDHRIKQIFQRYEFALHLYTFREALAPLCAPTQNDEETPSASTNVDARTVALRLRLQQSIALLRYVDLFQPDKVFFEAGDACREYDKEYEDFGFMLLNHCLDIAEAIEEGDAALVDNSAFDGTDVPQNYTIPNALYLTPNELEEVKEWVLAMSIGCNVTKKLKMDERGTFEASAIDPPGDESARQRPICAVSGYPILDESRIKELPRGRVADLASWSAFLHLTRYHASDQLFDVQEYLNK